MVAPSGSAGKKSTVADAGEQRKTPPERGFSDKRLKGLEPSTFCMASRRSSQLSYSREVAEYILGGLRGSGRREERDRAQVGHLELMVAVADEELHPRIRQWVPDQVARRSALREQSRWWVEVAASDLGYARDYRAHQPQSGAAAELYLDRWLRAAPDLWVQAGPRYRSRDPEMPFVGIAGSSRPITEHDLLALRELAEREFPAFAPLYVVFWSAGPARGWAGTDADSRLVAGRLGALRAREVPAQLSTRSLTDVPSAQYERYVEMHARHAAANPSHLLHTRASSREDLLASAGAGMLWDVEVDGTWAGMVAGRDDVASGMRGATVVELILDPSFTGRGYGEHLSVLLARGVPQPDEQFLFGTIHADNLRAYRAAQRAGREDVGGEVLVDTPRRCAGARLPGQG